MRSGGAAVAMGSAKISDEAMAVLNALGEEAEDVTGFKSEVGDSMEDVVIGAFRAPRSSEPSMPVLTVPVV